MIRPVILAVMLLGAAASCGGQRPVVGIGYQTWFPPQSWEEAWDEPLLGRYDSADHRVLRQHAAWLSEAGVDFVWIDWSNNIEAGPDHPHLLHIERATDELFQVYAQLERPPKISIFLGINGDPQWIENGGLTRKANQVYDAYAAKPEFRRLLFMYRGRPLLVIYVGTPSPFQHGLPAWNDDRFTVRWMSGFLDDQPSLITRGRVSRYGFWSWWDRWPQTYSVFDGRAEAMVVSAAFPGVRGWDSEGTRGRRGGRTFREQWARARQIGPQIVLVNSWNEWVPNEEISPELSNDLEPSRALGKQYLQWLGEEIAAFKSR